MAKNGLGQRPEHSAGARRRPAVPDSLSIKAQPCDDNVDVSSACLSVLRWISLRREGGQMGMFSIKYSTVYSLPCTVYSSQYTCYTIQWTVHMLYYTVHSTHVTLYSVQWRWCSCTAGAFLKRSRPWGAESYKQNCNKLCWSVLPLPALIFNLIKFS